MVRETRHLWVGNLPDNIREDRIREHFKRYGRVQSVKLLPPAPPPSSSSAAGAAASSSRSGGGAAGGGAPGVAGKEVEGACENTTACTVAFMDIKSASKAHTAEHKIDEKTLTTEYYEPAAIPSAASSSPQSAATPSSASSSTYAAASASPGGGTTRYTTNSHGVAEEHATFNNERFYESRSNSRVTESDYLRRVNYHESNRSSRNRERSYRNGPYVVDRHRPLNSSWTSYDSSSRSTYNSETGYGTTPSDGGSAATTDRRSSDSQSTKKKTKSHSGSRSVSPSGSNSSGSPVRSRSRSTSSSSSSSVSGASSSTGSPKSRKLASGATTSSSANSSSHQQPVVHSEDRRPLAICVRNLPLRSSDTSLKDGLFHEYKKHGKVTWVKIVGQASERHAIVCFKKPEDVEKALEVSYDKLFFGCKIEVASYQGYDVDDNELRPYEAEIDEFHPKATRTLFIGNLEKDVTASDLRKHFDQFGEIIEIDIKKQGAVSSYAFCQYSDIISVVKAIRAMDGEHLGNNRIKLGFGKSMPTDCVWVDGVVDSVNEKYLTLQFDSFGTIRQVIIDRDKGQALIFYEQVLNAQTAVAKMRGVSLRGRKIQVDFASRECQEAFYDHLDKQGHTAERPNFEERAPSTRTNFVESTAASTTTRFARYDTPSSRPRTASYGSRSSSTSNQCNATTASHSPSTPGSATPRGGSSRSRLARFSEYYDPNSEYADRRYRSYDEYSQGSGASHEETYDHEYPVYARESPSHADSADVRLQSHASEHVPVAFAPSDIRNLQKERFHLLEQLEDYTSSGEELGNAKKRIRLELVDNSVASDVIIEANRDHRKVMEVRRTSDASLKHHSRRPSVESKHGLREVGSSDRTYMPHSVCKRRKTGGSDSSSRIHHEFSGSESIGSSRPGTPLVDERPENFPSEPRRIPREREGPLSLPLPRFAAQLMGKGNVSVAGIKGQKDNTLASPPPAATSPRITNNVAPNLAHVPPPASPPPRPPSLSSNSSDSDVSPPSPSLDERIRSLDEKYEKWSGSRAVSAAGSEALAKLDSERFKFSCKLLEFDLKELQPSEIVKSVLAKPSVFDEDSKRLENVGGKYDFNLYTKAATTTTPTAPTSVSVPLTLKTTNVTAANPQLPKTPTMLSPRSSGSSIATAKSLQYPFPSHPPVQPVISTSSSPLQTPLPVSVGTSSSRSTSQSDARQKQHNVSSSSSGNEKSSKGNRQVTTNSVVISNLTQVKISDSASKAVTSGGVSILLNSSEVVSSTPTASSIEVGVAKQSSKSSTKHVDKVSDVKLTGRRDSTSSNNSSPRGGEVKRRNSETSNRKSDVCDKKAGDYCDSSNSSQKKVTDEKTMDTSSNGDVRSDRLELERMEKAKLEKERLDREALVAERERLEKERIEKENLERERMEAERRKEKEEKERREKEEKERREREEQERIEKERRERREREEKERREREERDRREREEKERREIEEKERREREEKERIEKEEKERREREEKERKEREREERERREREREEKERREREREEKDRREREERERREREESERTERERKREEERKHKEENEKRKDDHGRHESKHKELKESKSRDNHDLFRSNHESKSNHDNRDRYNSDGRKEDKKHFDREDRRKENAKENRENNLHDKVIASEIKENHKPGSESRHFSNDSDKSKNDPNRRRDRNNSLPVSVGSKRRISSQDSPDRIDDIKRMKMSQDHRKLSERRDSRDIKLDDKNRSKHKNNIAKIIEEKTRHDKINSVKEVSDEKRRERDKESDKHRHKQKSDKQKNKDIRSKEKDLSIISKQSTKDINTEKSFFASLETQSSEDLDKLQRQRKEVKEKRKQLDFSESDDRKGEEKKNDEKKKEKKSPQEQKNRDESFMISKSEERKCSKKDRIRRSTHNSSDAATDSDEPKKQSHSIFDIVDDEPAYISMYDKVKARSCKNMQKQEEEKRQEKLKAKFNQLKQSRAKREEKKRSTSWDEDSDSDHEQRERFSCKNEGGKSRRSTKLLIMSSDEDDYAVSSNVKQQQRKKKDIYTDSDSSKILNKFGSDSSDDDFNKKVATKIKQELFSDDENAFSMINYDHEKIGNKKIKEEDSKYIKKEKRNKHQDLSAEELNAHIFGDSPVSEIKVEPNFDRDSIYGERKKHKKKQKKQKHSLTSEDDIKMDMTNELSRSEERSKSVDKKKQHSKKDKKRDRNKDEDKHKDKSRKSKKPKIESSKSESKRDGKMENIFGSFSDDSEAGGCKDLERDETSKNNFINEFLNESDSDGVAQIEKERLREEHKKRKEKKRREKEKQRLREEELNENSVDYADLGKQLEASIKDDSNDIEESAISVKSECDERTEDVFRFNEGSDEQDQRKEIKEKKKKRKKSKEEKHKHHHHDRNKIKSPEIKKEIEPLPSLETIKNNEPVTNSSPSLPSLLDMPSSPIPNSPKPEHPSQTQASTSQDSQLSPLSSKTQLPQAKDNKKRDKFIPGFGSEIDEKIHETAVKSISEFEVTVKLEITEDVKDEDCKPLKSENKEDKPRVIISQEETEDAVAALLGESFGENEYNNCYDDEQPSDIMQDQHANVSEENIVEDLEEMRQAVQSLNSGDLDMKPDTPQSEQELQIDTDTEEPEDVVGETQFDPSPRTPEIIEEPQEPAKSIEIPSFKTVDIVKPSIVSACPSSPPLLTPIKPNVVLSEIKKSVDNPVLPQPVSIQSWPLYDTHKVLEIDNVKSTETNLLPNSSTASIKSVISSPSPKSTVSSFIVSSPLIQVSEQVPTSEPSVAVTCNVSEAITSQATGISQISQPTYSLHNMKYPSLQKLQTTLITTNMVTQNVPSSNVTYNRLPITPVVMSAPYQPSIKTLPQPKVAMGTVEPKTIQNPPTKIESNQESIKLIYPPNPPTSQILVGSTPSRMIVQSIQVQKTVGPLPQAVVKTTYSSQSMQEHHQKLIVASSLFPFTPAAQSSSSSVVDAKQPTVEQSPQISKPFMPVIQETPKVITNAPQPSIIQSTNKSLPVTSHQLAISDSASTVIQEEIKETPKAIVEVKKEVTQELPLTQPSVTQVQSHTQLQQTIQQIQPVKIQPIQLQPLPPLSLIIKASEEKALISPSAIKKEGTPEAALSTKSPLQEEGIVQKPLENTVPPTALISVPSFDSSTSVIKKTEKLEDEKGETESIESDISKERLSVDLVTKDDGLDSKEDSDYWSAKEVNIDSVIQKVDALCSADELSDHSGSELCKEDWYESESAKANVITEVPQKAVEKTDKTEATEQESFEATEVIKEKVPNLTTVEEVPQDQQIQFDEKEVTKSCGRRSGRNRGRKARGGAVTTRASPAITTPVITAKVIGKEVASTAVCVNKRASGRGGRAKIDRKSAKSDTETTSSDIYEFRDDFDENNGGSNKEQRPRLILTIKPPVTTTTLSVTTSSVATIIAKDSPPKIEKDEFVTPPSNTRKSRRLQERDISRNTVDDTIEDVVRNVAVATRSMTAAGTSNVVSPSQMQLRRTQRQYRKVSYKLPPVGVRCGAAGSTTPNTGNTGIRKKNRRASETVEDSSEEKLIKNENVPSASSETENIANPTKKSPVTTSIESEIKEQPKEKQHESLKAAFLRRVKGDANNQQQETMSLIDPVTGVLMPVRECSEEGQYVTVPGSNNSNERPNAANIQNKPQVVQPSQIPISAVESASQSVITSSSPVVLQQQKPQSLKHHVLASQAARMMVSQQQQHLQQQPQKPPQQAQVQKTVPVVPPPATQPTLVMKSGIPFNQHLNIAVSSPNLPPTHLSPKSIVQKTNLPAGVKLSPQPPPSPNQVYAHIKPQPKPILSQQQTSQPQQLIITGKQSSPTLLKAHFPMQAISTNVPSQLINTQVAYAKQLGVGKTTPVKTTPHSLLSTTQMLPGTVASPMKSVHPQQQQLIPSPGARLMQTSATLPSAIAKSGMELSTKVDSGLVPRPTSSPQGQASRNIMQSGLPTIPPYEANMHGERGVYNRSRSPPPAHQNSPSPQGEALAHFPAASVKLRPPHDILPPHYMHPQHVMYQQYLRQQPYHLSRSPLISSNLEKSVDGQEGEEAPVELRRPGSVGLALTGRSLAVSHNLQSPHDRSTDSPQIGQVYSMHNSRIPQYHSGRYFEQATEPPPAHRPITSHTSYADRPMSHMGPLGTPDRPLSSHLPPDRPLSSHLLPDRPISSHLPTDRPLSNHLPPDRPLSSHLAPERSLTGLHSERAIGGHVALGATHPGSLGTPDRPLSGHSFNLGAGLGAAGNLMGAVARHIGAEAPATQRGLQAATPPHASQVPPQAESLLMLLKQYPCMWQGLLALKNDQAAVQMYFVSGNDQVAKCCLPKNIDGSTPPLRIFQRMRLEPPQVEGVARKMQMENEHCMLLALPCGHDHMDVLKQSTNLTTGFITYLQQKQAAGIVNVAAPGTTQPPAYVVHIFPSCDFVNENLRRIAPNLLERVSDIAHLLIVITTV